MKKILQSLGPGLLFAGAAIGVSHLVQSTRAGADFGFGLLWALLLVNLFKYPFFQESRGNFSGFSSMDRERSEPEEKLCGFNNICEASLNKNWVVLISLESRVQRAGRKIDSLLSFGVSEVVWKWFQFPLNRDRSESEEKLRRFSIVWP